MMKRLLLQMEANVLRVRSLGWTHTHRLTQRPRLMHLSKQDGCETKHRHKGNKDKQIHEPTLCSTDLQSIRSALSSHVCVLFGGAQMCLRVSSVCVWPQTPKPDRREHVGMYIWIKALGGTSDEVREGGREGERTGCTFFKLASGKTYKVWAWWQGTRGERKERRNSIVWSSHESA